MKPTQRRSSSAHEVRYNARTFWLVAVCGLLLSAGAIAIATMVVVRNPDPTTRWTFIGLAGACTAGMGLLCLSTATYRLTLLSDRLESHGLFRRRELMRDAIEGFRIKPSGTVRLQARPGDGQSLEFSHYLFADPALGEWLQDLESLDDRDTAAEEAKIAADERLGLSQPERDANLRVLGRWKWAAHILGLASIFGLWFAPPSFYWPAMGFGVVAPAVILALTVLWKGLVTIAENDNSPAIDLTGLWLFPILGLAVRMMMDVYPLTHGNEGFLQGGVLGVAAWLVLLWANRGMRKVWLVAFSLVLSLLWGCASLCAINVGLDRHPLRHVSAKVVSREPDKNDLTLTLRTLEPKPQTIDDFTVRARSGPYPVGSVVQLTFGQGFFGWPYIDKRPFQLSRKG